MRDLKMQSLHPLFLIIMLLMWVPGNNALALDDISISELSMLDRQYMLQQRTLLGDLSARHFGRQFNGNRDNDLALLQRLLDEGLVTNDQTLELQAMGIIMGDLLAADLDLDWVIYEDKYGRSRALRYRQTDNYLFPVTMIARRREANNLTPVNEIYNKAHATMTAALPALPFQ